MRMLTWLAAVIFLFSCGPPPAKQKVHFSCNLLLDKQFIDSIARSVLDKGNEHIWNLSAIDTSEYLSTEDYFTNATTKNRLVFIGGEAGLSAGTAHNLLILFSCLDSLSIVWAGQIGDFDMLDLNNDGIKDIVCNSGTTWMGECNDSYDIFNFKGSDRHMLYSARSTSVLDCGQDSLGDVYKKGDTLESKFDCSVVRPFGKHYLVQQIRTIKIHNGGETNRDITKNLLITKDTTLVALK